MFVELHLLQNFAPSNLNRDDTNSPKDCEFGGYRRARISSQAIKRAMRREFATRDLIDADHRALRTKRLGGELADRLVAAGKDPAEAERVSASALQGLGLKYQDAKDPEAEKKTQYLVFLGAREIQALADLCLEQWDALLASADDEAGKRKKQASGAELPKDLVTAFKRALDGGQAADVALFGRMLANLPDRNIDAASQVAHAISTNRVTTEFDFYTAVDDLKPEDTEGAEMMGTVEFNSACFYRYANVDLDQLTRNLDGDGELARETLRAFIAAAVAAIPTGKQNSMAAQNPPSFVMAVVRDRGLWSLANAFLKPVAPGREGDLMAMSQRTLDAYWDQLTRMYGRDGIAGAWCVSLDGSNLTALKEAQVGTVQELLANVLTAVAGAESVGAPA